MLDLENVLGLQGTLFSMMFLAGLPAGKESFPAKAGRGFPIF